jgi:hypothetical protein
MNDCRIGHQWTGHRIATAMLALLGALLVCFAAWDGARAQEDAAADDVPRMPDGRPDLSGNWDTGRGIDFIRPQTDGRSVCVSGCAPRPAAGGGGFERNFPRYKPEYLDRVRDLEARQVQEDPVLRCFAPGVPRIGPPHKVVQRHDEVVFLYDDVNGNFFRVIPTDGRGHRQGIEASYLGDAIGWWEDDVLVVETVNFTDNTWLTDDGAFHTANLRVVERLWRVGNALEWQATAYDAGVLVEPWTLDKRTSPMTDEQILEAPPCIERDLDHMVEESYHANPR